MNSYPIVIVLFQPSQRSIDRILSFTDLGFEFYIFDNSKYINESLINLKGVKYYHTGINYGLSYCIDFLSIKILNDNFDKFIFFDQDTIFTKETLYYIEDFIKFQNFADDPYLKRVVSVNFRDNISYPSWNIITTKKFEGYLLNSVYFNINSGTLYNLKYFKEFKWFDQNFFVDGVDYVFSLNAIINNYKNISVNFVPGLNHTEEQNDYTITFLGKKLTSRVYPLTRNLDFVKSHFLILFKCFQLRRIKPIIFIVRAILSYIFIQFIFRIRFSFK